MKLNVGAADRAVRITIGVALVLAAVVVDSELRWFGLLGIIPLLTGAFGTCPMYSLFGISTCAARKSRA